ncbi:MAG TPA: hypothetical protein DD435_14020 [Cyanobacteria bacterium UBA8530]|nr:hypothetical protein [Cyanobacteria bacterium UBA8530]
MFGTILGFILEQGSARVTEISRTFELPPSMAASLVLQLEDLGFIEECEKSEGGCGQGCGDSCHGGHACASGGCRINPPYRLTQAGRDYLKK